MSTTELGERLGIVGGGNQVGLLVIGANKDICVGEMLLIRSKRDGGERIFLFRVLELENYMRLVKDTHAMAGTFLVEGEAYISGIDRNLLVLLKGRLLGYAEQVTDGHGKTKWVFRPPRRLPALLAEVYRPTRTVTPSSLPDMLASQLRGDIYIGNLQAGERELDIPVTLPAEYLPMHVAIFGATGSGKSNLMMVLIKSIIDHNIKVLDGKAAGPSISAFCIDPHDEFARGVDKYGVNDIVAALDSDTRRHVIGDYYYLTTSARGTPREIQRYARDIRILWKEIQPRDLYSIMEFRPQMQLFIDRQYAIKGENWIASILEMEESPSGVQAVTFHAVRRRLGFIERSPIFVESGKSVLGEIYEAMESGRVLIVNTSLMSETSQFLLTTVVARTIFDMRRAVKSSGTIADFESQAKSRLPATFLRGVLDKAKGFYRGRGAAGDSAPVKDTSELPVVLVTVEEAPSLLNPDLMRGGSVFKDIARQGRKFNIGLLVVSQQVSVLDNVILSQTNTEINLRLGNEREISACIDNASVNIAGFEDEFRVMGRGDAILTASYRDMPVPVHVPKFDELFERTQAQYGTKREKKEEHIM